MKRFAAILLAIVLIISLVPSLTTLAAPESVALNDGGTENGGEDNEDTTPTIPGEGGENEKTEPEVEYISLENPTMSIYIEDKLVYTNVKSDSEETEPGEGTDAPAEKAPVFDYNPGDKVRIEISWDDIKDGCYLNELQYQLVYDSNFIIEDTEPAQFSATVKTADGETQVNAGAWYIENGVLHVKFSDDFQNGSDRSFGLTLTGTIPTNPREDDKEEGKQVKIGEATINVRPHYEESEATVEKTMSPIVPDGSGNYTSKATIKVKVTGGHVYGVTLTDTVTAPLQFAEDLNLKASYKSSDGSQTVNLTEGTDYTLTETEGSFTLNFNDSFYDGEEITITYDLFIPGDAVRGSGEIKFDNSIGGGYKDQDGGDKVWDNKIEQLPVVKPKLSKSGYSTKDTSGINTITWTITFNSGSLGNLRDLIGKSSNELKDLGWKDGKIIITDTLPDGLLLIDGFLTMNDDRTITIDVLDGIAKGYIKEPAQADKDGGYTYTITFKTKVTGDAYFYDNHAESHTPLGDVEHHYQTEISVTFLKYRVGPLWEELNPEDNDGNQNVPPLVWRIKTNMPSSFDTFKITDTPQLDTANKPGYVQKFIEDSIRIDLDNEVTLDGWTNGYTIKDLAIHYGWTEASQKTPEKYLGITINLMPLENGVVGFTFTVDPEGVFKNRRGTEAFTIFFKTETVDKNGSRDGSQIYEKSTLEGAAEDQFDETTFRWQNNASLYVKNGDEEIEKTDYHYYKHLALPQINKHFVTMTSDNDGIMRVWIRMQGTPIILFDEVAGTDENGDIVTKMVLNEESILNCHSWSVRFKDTLPENTFYEEGSAYVSLVKSVDYEATNSNFTDRAPETNETFDELTKLLVREDGTDEDSGRSYIIFTWDSDEADEKGVDLVNLLKGFIGDKTDDYDLVIWYDLRIKDYEQYAGDDSSTKNKFTNNVTNGYVNERPVADTSASITYKGMEILEKRGEYDEDLEKKYAGNKFLETIPGQLNVPFFVTINPQNYALSGSREGTITLKDTMGSSLALIEESLELKYKGTDTVLKAIVCSSESELNNKTLGDDEFAYYLNGKVLIIKAKDATAYELSYWCEITDKPKTTSPTGRKTFGKLKDASNYIELFAGSVEEKTETIEYETIMVPSAWAKMGSGDEEAFYLEVFKYTGNMRALNGAKFELVKGSFNTAGEFVQVGSAYGTETIENPATSITGYTFYLITLADAQKYVFRLTETDAPDHYLKDETEHFFVFEEYEGNKDSLPDYVEVRDALDRIEIKNDTDPSNPPPTPDPEPDPKTPTTGDLTVSKTVMGEEEDMALEFTFTVTLSGEYTDENGETQDAAALSGEYGDMTFVDGVAEFTLKHGESLTATGLPAGITYEVTEAEADQDGFDTSSTDSVGVIPAGDTATAAFVNKKIVPAFGDLTVSKTVAGNAGNTAAQFHFTVMLSDSTVNGVYGDMTFVDGVAEFTLRHGKSKTATGLPAGVTYFVTETEANEDGYVTTVTGENGTITAEETAETSFVNTKNEEIDPGTGNLIVSKIVGGTEGDRDFAFHFTVTLSDTSINGVYGEMTFVNGVAEFTLKHGESVTARGLPAGVDYEVMELEANRDYYTTVSKGRGEIVPDEGSANAVFFNTRGEKLPDDPELDEFDDPEIPLAEWPEEPKTGDEWPWVGVWVLLALMSLGGISVVFMKMRGLSIIKRRK